MMETITGTDYKFPGQTGVYHGKVRDIYTINNTSLVAVASDRISAFDVILSRAIPYKGQVLNQIAAYFLDQTKEIVPNWYISSPDPNVSIGHKCEPIRVEMVVRGMMVGHLWREYSSGKRVVCGASLPEGLKEYELLEHPIITPTTKMEAGHDEDISPDEIINQGIVKRELYNEMNDLTLELFAHGQQEAQSKGLILADTKYEFGLLDNKLIIIDEIHTPDSSRYFYEESHKLFVEGSSDKKPKNLSKEFVRAWLIDRGFNGQQDQDVPDMDDDFVKEISDRYIELYEKITGQAFARQDYSDAVNRIEKNVIKELENLGAAI